MKPILRGCSSEVKQLSESFCVPEGNGGPIRTRRAVGPKTRLRRDFKRDEEGTLEISSRLFRDGTILELVEDPTDPSRTLLVVRNGDSTKFVQEYEHAGRRFAPVSREEEIVGAFSLPDGFEQPGSAPKLALSVADFLLRSVPIAEGVQLILGAFVVCSWLPELLPHFPCLVVLGPSDVTVRLLRTLRLVCRHALLVGEATGGGILQACSRWQTTLLLFDHGLRSDVYRTVKAGVWRDMRTLHRAGLLSGFGPKVIAAPEMPIGIEDFESALALSLLRGNARHRSMLGDLEKEDQAKHLRRRLLGLRMDLLAQPESLAGAALAPAVVPVLPGRCLTVPFVEDEEFCQKLLLEASLKCRHASRLLPVRHRAVSSALFFLCHEERTDIEISELTTSSNKILEREQEDMRVTPKKVGSILTALGFPPRDRTSLGYSLECSDYVKDHLHILAGNYGVVPLDIYRHLKPSIYCRYCREHELVSKKQIENYENEEAKREKEG